MKIILEIERWADAEKKARQLGIGQYRRIPRKRRVSNAARIGIVPVKKLKKEKEKEKKEQRKQKRMGDVSKLSQILGDK